MDNIREKLVELLKDTENIVRAWCGSYEDAADELIANGVTVQEWIPVTERLPKKDGAYLVTTNCFGKYQCIDIRCFAKDGEAVDKYDLGEKKDVWYSYDSEYGHVSTDSVTHWMPLPTPPKKEE